MRQPSLSPLRYVFTSQLNLSGNALCGVHPYIDACTYTAEGIKAIANALKGNASLTSLLLGDNYLGDKGVEALSVGLKESKSLATLDLSNKNGYSTKFGPAGAATLASAIAVMASITSVRSPAHQPTPMCASQRPILLTHIIFASILASLVYAA